MRTSSWSAVAAIVSIAETIAGALIERSTPNPELYERVARLEEKLELTTSKDLLEKVARLEAKVENLEKELEAPLPPQ